MEKELIREVVITPKDFEGNKYYEIALKLEGLDNPIILKPKDTDKKLFNYLLDKEFSNK